jgi:hypothetical protein
MARGLVGAAATRAPSNSKSYFRPSSWRPQRLTPRALTLAQQAKANTARADAEAVRPGERKFDAVPRLALPPISNLSLSVLAAPSGGAAAAEGQDAANALDMDWGSCGFGRVRSRPAKIIKGAKKAP